MSLSDGNQPESSCKICQFLEPLKLTYELDENSADPIIVLLVMRTSWDEPSQIPWSMVPTPIGWFFKRPTKIGSRIILSVGKKNYKLPFSWPFADNCKLPVLLNYNSSQQPCDQKDRTIPSQTDMFDAFKCTILYYTPFYFLVLIEKITTLIYTYEIFKS